MEVHASLDNGSKLVLVSKLCPCESARSLSKADAGLCHVPRTSLGVDWKGRTALRLTSTCVYSEEL